MNHLFKVMPQHLNQIHVRSLTKPLKSLHFVFLKPFRGGLDRVFCIIVLLQNPSVQLEVMNTSVLLFAPEVFGISTVFLFVVCFCFFLLSHVGHFWADSLSYGGVMNTDLN